VPVDRPYPVQVTVDRPYPVRVDRPVPVPVPVQVPGLIIFKPFIFYFSFYLKFEI
jgi:hypothetical protein